MRATGVEAVEVPVTCHRCGATHDYDAEYEFETGAVNFEPSEHECLSCDAPLEAE